jgi:lipoprotein-anchoring transpeptidase ErfK/SrfK
VAGGKRAERAQPTGGEDGGLAGVRTATGETVAAERAATRFGNLCLRMRLPRLPLKKNLRTILYVGSAAAAVLVAVALAWAIGREVTAGTISKAAETTTTTAAPVEIDQAVIATTTGTDIDVYSAPEEGAAVQTTLSAITDDYLIPRTLLVVDEMPADSIDAAILTPAATTTVQTTAELGTIPPATAAPENPEWLQILVPERPNGGTGWIRGDAVTLSTTAYEIKIELGAHKLTLYNGDEVVLETQTVNGTSETPTPLGQYYITDPVDLQASPSGGYGAFALGISGYSDVLLSFNGGPGQIAVHGTVQTDLLGTDASNGCIRIDNESVLQIANTVPVGTPVEIVP